MARLGVVVHAAVAIVVLPLATALRAVPGKGGEKKPASLDRVVTNASRASNVFGSTLGRFRASKRCQQLKPEACMATTTVVSSAWCPSLNAAYIKVPEAYTKEARHVMQKVCGKKKLSPEQEFHEARFEMGGSCPPYAFAFVRNPLDRAILAYAEIDAKAQFKDSCSMAMVLANVSFSKLPRHKESEPMRFEAFLKDSRDGKIPKVCEPKHSSTQVETLCSVPDSALQAIGHVESFEKDMRGMLASIEKRKGPECKQQGQANLQKNLQKEDFGEKSPPYSKKAKAVRHADIQDVRASLRASTKKLVCSIYDADYECLGYERPQECRGAGGK